MVSAGVCGARRPEVLEAWINMIVFGRSFYALIAFKSGPSRVASNAHGVALTSLAFF
jgi:hypothetical protein